MKMPKEIGIDPTLLLVEGRVRLAQLLYVHEHNLLVGVLKIGIGSNVGIRDGHVVFMLNLVFHAGLIG